MDEGRVEDNALTWTRATIGIFPGVSVIPATFGMLGLVIMIAGRIIIERTSISEMRESAFDLISIFFIFLAWEFLSLRPSSALTRADDPLLNQYVSCVSARASLKTFVFKDHLLSLRIIVRY